MNKRFLNKIKFGLHLDPVVEKTKNISKFIPEGKKSVLIFYADFELAWAWRFVKSVSDSKQYSEKMGLKERENMPVIIDVHDEYDIPVTFATVGHLFLNECDGVHSDVKRLNHFENEFWKFDKGDWYDGDAAGNYETDGAYYCPDLIDKIINAKTKHEIGCHTFSHIDCTDRVCSKEVFDSEIRKCIELAKEKKIELKSFVHPAHTIGNLDSLIDLGFESYRTDYGNILGYPEKYKNKLWQIKSTWEFVVFDEWSIEYHIKRYKEIINRGIKSNTVCVLWFHPSMNIKFFTDIAPEVFKYISERKDEIAVMTAGEYTKFLNSCDV